MQASKTQSDSTHKQAGGMVSENELATLRDEITADGEVDQFISAKVERRLIQRGQQLGLPEDSIEAVLHDVCRKAGWSRENGLVTDMRDQLETAVVSGKNLDQIYFDLAVNYAVSLGMPRKSALRHCLQLVVDHEWPIKTGLLGQNWFESLRTTIHE